MKETRIRELLIKWGLIVSVTVPLGAIALLLTAYFRAGEQKYALTMAILVVIFFAAVAATLIFDPKYKRSNR